MGPRPKMLSKKPVSLSFVAVSLLIGAVSCLRHQTENRAQVLAGDEDLVPDQTNPSSISANVPAMPDKSFCKDRSPGTCFSLIIKIPKSELVEDLGLSVLSLGASSQSMQLKLDEACAAAWVDYRQRYVNDNTHRVRRDFVRTVEKMRCIFQFIREEAATEDTRLANNEIGLSVRLTKFVLSGATTEASSSVLGLKIENKSVETSFRSVSIYSGRALNQARNGWEPSRGFGPEPINTKSILERKIEWHWDHVAILGNIQKIIIDPSVSQAGVLAFLKLAKAQLARANSAPNPASASPLLLGMGYNVLRTICGENAKLCKIRTTPTDVTTNVEHDLAGLVPSSDTNELLRLSMIRSLQSVLDKIFVKHDRKQLEDSFQIN